MGSSTAFVSLPSSVIKGRISSFFSLGKTTTHVSEDSDNPSDISKKILYEPPDVAVVDTAPPPWCHFGTPPPVDIVAD